MGIDTTERRDAQGQALAPDDARIDALLARQVTVPQATEAEARRFYDRHQARFTSETLIEAEHILKRVKGIAHTRFTSKDVVRHPLVARIVDAYDAARKNEK